MAQLSDEHGGHAIQCRAALLFDRSERRLRIEPGRGVYDRRAAGYAGQIAHHHAETMIERNGYADAVADRELLSAADERTVVENIAMRKRRAFRLTGGAARELDVDRIAGVEARTDLRDPAKIGRRCHGGHRIEFAPARAP